MQKRLWGVHIVPTEKKRVSEEGIEARKEEGKENAESASGRKSRSAFTVPAAFLAGIPHSPILVETVDAHTWTHTPAGRQVG